MFKKKSLFLLRLIFLILILFSTLMAVDRVRSLKAFDSSYEKLPVKEDSWQNYTKRILFEWKEPWGDIKEYLYYFGQDSNGTPVNSTTELAYTSPELKNSGIYYFNIIVVDINDERSTVKSFAVNYDSTPIANTLQVYSYASEKKQQVLADNTAQNITNKPFFVFQVPETAKNEAPVKGLNIYWGDNAQGVPDKHIKGDSLSIYSRTPANKKHYLRSNIEDVAGNISETKTIFVFEFNGETPQETAKPDMVILGRDISVDNSTENASEAYPGSRITYKIKLRNKGAGPAYNIEIKDVIPENTTCVIGSGKADKPAIVEYFNRKLNGGKGAWTATPEEATSEISSIRWIFKERFDPTVQAEATYSVQVNQ